MAVMDVTEELLEKRWVWKLRYLFLQKPFFLLLSRFLCITVGFNLRNMHYSLCFSLEKPFKKVSLVPQTTSCWGVGYSAGDCIT